MAVISVTAANFAEITGTGKKVLIDFYADWCAPCKRLGPRVEQFSEKFPDVTVGKVNIDSEMELAMKFGVMSVPTLVVLRDGLPVAKSVGEIDYDRIVSLVSEA